MNRWIGIAIGAAIALVVITQWGEIERYRRMSSM
jgi:hypothetical protein